MFRKKDEDGEATGDGTPGSGNEVGDMDAPPLKPFSKRGSHAPAKPPQANAFRADAPRRVVDLPGGPRRTERPRRSDGESRKLTVGRETRLNGEITSCDKLVVEGEVEASLSDARVIEVAPTGFFKGNAQVDEADISGHFEGELVARDQLIVRAGGRISGSIRYGRIVIESGGEISGDMQTLSPSEPGDEGIAAPAKDPVGHSKTS
jgi:cytoskeletal protein CcmA (bactofilin family)